LGQPVCMPCRYVVCVNHFTVLLRTVVSRFMSLLICSACLDKIVSNRVKDSCISLINVFLCVAGCILRTVLLVTFYVSRSMCAVPLGMQVTLTLLALRHTRCGNKETGFML
jgi:hypothetical protein